MDSAGRRELARLISEDGLSPKQAAARLEVEESEVRAWIGRWYASDEAAQRFAAFALRPDGEAAPSAPPAVAVASVPWHANRRRLAGVGLVLAFVPVGWVVSAALFGGDDGKGRTGDRVAGAPPVRDAPGRFSAKAVRARRGRHTVSVAHVKARRVKVYAKGDPKAKHTTLKARTLDGKKLPLVLLVEKRRDKWLQVQLPTRPNLATGWIRQRSARLSQTNWRLRVDLSAHTVTTWRGRRKVSVHRIGVGKSVSPTPRGRYYLTDLVKPPKPDGLYGAYAFGLSAHSNVYTSFGAGDGQIGLHGTNDPKTLGTQVSHGCIRVANDVIESFARHLPLGTPVTIRS